MACDEWSDPSQREAVCVVLDTVPRAWATMNHEGFGPSKGGTTMIELLMLAATIGEPNVRMPPDFYHLCITEHPNDSRASWQCAVDMDLANREQIGEAGFKRLEVCRRTLSNLDPSREHSLMLQVDGQEFECTGRPPPATAPARK